MILTIPVLVYQLTFVLILYVASRFGPRVLLVATLCCLLWTATHVFLLPLALLQATVIGVSWWVFRRRHLKVPAAERPE